MWKEARVDIPPLMRGFTWAALLGVEVKKKREGWKLINSGRKKRMKVLSECVLFKLLENYVVKYEH